MAYADIMAKVSTITSSITGRQQSRVIVQLEMIINSFFHIPQSCHIDEEEEGDEQSAEDEMSFEVRQSELVMGGEGQGTRNTAER